MGRKRHTPEQIITALREAEVGLARGKSVKLMQPGASSMASPSRGPGRPPPAPGHHAGP